jgi:hypothetical protein
MTHPAPSAATDATFRSIQRRLAERLSGGDASGSAGVPIEAMRVGNVEPPRLVASDVIEGHALRALRTDAVAGEDDGGGFGAFLDGTQHSHVLRYEEGLPIVFGTVAAVVRVRRNRRMVTWARGPVVERRVYAPCHYLPPAVCIELEALDAAGVPVVDTTEPDEHGERPSAHPLSLLERAVHFVQADRERVEQRLGELWCQTAEAPLFIDGGVSASDRIATSTCTVGVIKSHRTLYVDGADVRTVLGLKRGQRSSVFRIAAMRRTPVASWYLRLRDPAGHDPMWGLVRIEAAERADTVERADDLTRRANRISRWVLAETSPLALPDARWDKMAYGIRDCEEYLKAIC